MALSDVKIRAAKASSERTAKLSDGGLQLWITHGVETLEHCVLLRRKAEEA
jgi:hypothetical protein